MDDKTIAVHVDESRAQAADLLVLGCHGHSRLPEPCPGGVSRTVLTEADLPLLPAH
jgi:nucleotide-binding universal stress UspA family protein